MGVFVRQAGEWVDVTPRARDDGQWTDNQDSWYVRDEGVWKLVYPEEPTGDGVLLPVEGLRSTFVDWQSMEAEWSNPDQPFVDATGAQVRIRELTSVWDEYDGPPDGYAHGALLPETNYQLEVRLVRRVAGVVTHMSVVRSVFFTTLEAPVAEPAPGPGGGGNTTFRLPPTNNPGTVGSSACWWYVWLQVWDVEAWGWVDTSPLVDDEVDGDGDDWTPDMTGLPSGTYRVARREVCNGVLGDTEYGAPFANPLDWDEACAGILPSTSASHTPYTDAVWAIPHVCTTDTPARLAMFDGVSNLELARGSNYGFVSYDGDGEWGVVSDSMGGGFSPAPSVYEGALPAVPTVFTPGADWSIAGGFEFGPTFASHSAGELPHLVMGGVHQVRMLFGPASMQVIAYLTLDNGTVLELDSVPVAYTVGPQHEWVLRCDGGVYSLWLNDTKCDEDTPAAGLYDGPVGVSLVGHLPDGMRLRKHYAWDRALSDVEVSQIHAPALTGWWGIAFQERTTYTKRVAGDNIVKLAGAAGYNSGPSNAGGACVVTVPDGEFVVSIGASGAQGQVPDDVVNNRETWGFGGFGGALGSSGGMFPSPWHGGGRSEIRTGPSRTTAIVIAPGGGAATNAGGGGPGGFPDGQPASDSGSGGFGGRQAQGASSSAPGLGAHGFAAGNSGWTGDGGTQRDSGAAKDPVTADVGSGGRGGDGTNSFGSGGGGGGGGGGKHGGGGGSGGNGSSTNGGGGGGGSGDTSGADTVIATYNGVNLNHGIVAMQVRATYSEMAQAFLRANNPARYIPGEECVDQNCVVVTDLVTGKGFWDRYAATIFDGTQTGRFRYQQAQKMLGRAAMHVSRNNSIQADDFQMRAVEAAGEVWNPPALNAGAGWAIEWTQQSIAGTEVAGPGAHSTTTPGSYANAAGGAMPWRVRATATTIELSLSTTNLSTVVSATSPALTSRAITNVTRYGVSYNPATDTFHFYRSDGVTATRTRAAAGLPTTGVWQNANRPILNCTTESNNESLMQDVAVFDRHRTQAEFNAGAGNLSGQLYLYTGAVQNFTVPAGATNVRFVVVASEGGPNGNGFDLGGGGALVEGRLAVTAGQQFDIIVGGQAAVFGGGVRGQQTGTDDGGYGGDYSAVIEHGVTFTNTAAALIAGGGGGPGSAANGAGGDGGYPAGGDKDGKGGTQSAGGLKGTGGAYPGADGAALVGGSGAVVPGGLDEAGGGGGGGYFGGGAGAGDPGLGTAAGGGSSHARADVADVAHVNGFNHSGTGWIAVTWW